MRNIFTFIFFTFFIFSCAGQSFKGIRVDYLKGLTLEIDGAGEIFTYDTVSLDESHYLMNSNLSFGAMIINGRLIQLKLVSEKKLLHSKYIDVFKGGAYKIIITTNRKLIDGGKFTSEGVMEIIMGKLKRRIKIRTAGFDPRYK